MLGAVLPQGRDDDPLLCLFTTEVAAEQAKLTPGHVAPHPNIHRLEVAEKRGAVLVSRKGELSEARQDAAAAKHASGEVGLALCTALCGKEEGRQETPSG